jgi:hypothetical protein
MAPALVYRAYGLTGRRGNRMASITFDSRTFACLQDQKGEHSSPGGLTEPLYCSSVWDCPVDSIKPPQEPEPEWKDKASPTGFEPVLPT